MTEDKQYEANIDRVKRVVKPIITGERLVPQPPFSYQPQLGTELGNQQQIMPENQDDLVADAVARAAYAEVLGALEEMKPQLAKAIEARLTEYYKTPWDALMPDQRLAPLIELSTALRAAPRGKP